MEFLVAAGSLLWIALIFLPWQPWRTREHLELKVEPGGGPDLSDVTVLIPARNEAAGIVRTLSALDKQGFGLQVILVDDQSTDETVPLAKATMTSGLQVIKGEPLPPDWTGKLWALEQGWRQTKTEHVLLLDADIELDPPMVGQLKQKLINEQLGFV